MKAAVIMEGGIPVETQLGNQSDAVRTETPRDQRKAMHLGMNDQAHRHKPRRSSWVFPKGPGK